jgi:hypothetical protein
MQHLCRTWSHVPTTMPSARGRQQTAMAAAAAEDEEEKGEERK